MRLLRLELAGFGPYRDRFEIDFASFDADGLYLIAGPTGAGKSTILDAITYALYGGAPRYAKGAAHLRSDLAGPADLTWVELEVAVGDRILRVRRTPEYERPKLRGTGLTKERATATLWERDGDGWRTLATSVDDASAEVVRSLGLRKDEFLKVILLAQGGFAEFLAASSDERKALLERLFGTGSMRRLRELLVADAKAITAEREALERERDERAARVRDAAASLLADDEEALPDGADQAALAALEAAIDERVAQSAEVAAGAGAAEREARAARDEAKALLERIARRDSALTALAGLAEAAAAIDDDRERLADADRAAGVAAELDRWARADAGVERSIAELDAATAALPAGVAGERPIVEAEHEAAVRVASRATETRALEASLPGLDRQATAAEEAAAQAQAAVDAAKRRRADAPAARRLLSDAREAATALAAGADAAARQVDAALERLEARDAADALAEPLAAARAEAVRSAAAQHTAADELHRLQAARIDGMAGELASELADGAPCPVCGSTEHPAPHAPASEAVTADDVAAAIERSQRALAGASAAHEALAALEQRLAAAEARAGDDDRASLERALEEARAAVRVAADAALERDEAERQLAEHDAAAERLDAEVAEVELAAAASAAEAATACARRDDARDRLAEELGEHPDARALLAAATGRRDALRRWLDADAHAGAARAEQHAAASAGAAALAEHALPDREATAGMRLEPAARKALLARITTHDAAVASARGVLAQPDLDGLGEPPELEPLEAALGEASAVAARANRAAAAAETTRDLAAADLAAAREAIRSLAEGAEHADAVRGLARALDGRNERAQDIETYVLATRLATIIDAANLRLAAMTDGRFTLVLDEARASHGRASGLGIAVLDAHTGLARPTRSLSGGETFLASLSLALGLADVVQAEAGGVSLETLFVDEGFGSLDQDTLEAAMATLDELRAGGRTVGVISHVQQMQERIPSRIRVVPLPGGGSRIEVSPPSAQGIAEPAR
ncbi:AAA family ATPase [Agrococcus sp. SCSIO52902]|uniref:AAA family ATPase n=1 Tax=Agrococcus sp. SCSIO52902 TaxID=2933290 RepID=UPI001FF5642F|nr:AAA family ATPase [Agrococcus sp. SCSIO52902]UOW00985.1 AAA family ATPase [Agrococcus sp. SCSIO52902]